MSLLRRGLTRLNLTKQGRIVHRSGLNNENNKHENKELKKKLSLLINEDDIQFFLPKSF